MLPTAVGLRKVVMSDKWQQISLKLEADLAQALREMKQGHDESLSEVVIRLLKRAVRQNPTGPLSARGARPARGDRPARGARPVRGERPVRGGRSNATVSSGRGAVGNGRKGKPPLSADRAGSGAPARGKPWAAPAASEWAEGSNKPKPAWSAAPQRGLRRSAGKPSKPGPGRPVRAPRPQPIEGSSEPRRRPFRAGAEGPRSVGTSAEQGTASDRPKRPRKPKGRPANGR